MNDPTPDATPRRETRARALWYGLFGFVLGALVATGVAVAVDDDPGVEVDYGRVDLAGADTASDQDPPAADPEPDADPAGDDDPVDEADDADDAGDDDVGTSDPEPEEPVRVLIVGDSIAAQIGWSLELWSEENPGVITVFNESHIGCGVVRYGQKRVADGSSGPVGDVCSDWAEPVPLQTVAEAEVVSWPTAIELFEPEIVVAMISGWDAVDRIVPGVADDWVAFGDPIYDTYAYENYLAATDLLTAEGAHLHWLVSPYLNAPILHDDHRERIDLLNAVVVDGAATMGTREVTFLDYPGFIGEPGGDRDVLIRDDGVHLSDQGFAEVAPWLVEQLGLT